MSDVPYEQQPQNPEYGAYGNPQPQYGNPPPPPISGGQQQPLYYNQPMHQMHAGGAVGASAGGGHPKVVVASNESAFDPSVGGPRHNANERFAPAEGCRDAIWAVLFVIQFFIIFVLACYYSSHNGCSDTGTCENSFKMSGNIYGLIIILLLASAIFSAVYLMIVRAYPSGIIKFTLGCCVALLFLNAIVLFAVGQPVGAVFMLLATILQCVWIYFVRNRIPFSATILGIAAETMGKYPAMVYTSYLFIVFQAVWLIIWIVAAASILNAMNNQDNGGGGQGLVVFLLLISFYWTSQVLKNIVHVTCSGTFASWYFLAPQQMPSNPTIAALKRASWTSLGSICLGSLIIAVLQAMRSMLRMGKNNRNGFVRCCLECILNCLESMIRFFNVYAFTHVAVYGATYCDAAKQTWELLRSRGWDLLINDQLISPVLTFGAIFVGLLGAVVGIVIAKFAMDLEYPGWWAFIGFLIGFAVSLCAMEVVESCIATLFVCFAEDPNALANTKPVEYNRLDGAFRGRMVELQAANRAAGNQM